MNDRSSFVVPAEHLVIGARGPEVRISGRVAAFLNHYARLDDFRRDNRGRDQELDAALVALHLAADEWRRQATSTATGTTPAVEPEPATPSETMSTSTAAARLHITERAVRKAIDSGRLNASKVDGRWRIHRDDLTHYQQGNRA